jgi:type I restriction enzyme S subunit
MMGPAMSEIPKGYKQTEVGVIPADWEVKRIADLNPFVTSGSRGWARHYSEHGSPFIRITNLSRSCIYPDLNDLRFVSIAADDSEAARTQLRDGDVLISITADIGIVGHVTPNLLKPAYINQHIALIRFDSDQTNSRFVSYFLASESPQKFFRALTDSGAKAGLNLTTVQQIRIALPPTKAEQEAIAEALSDADAFIESLDQLLAKKRQIKQGAIQEMLIGKKRLLGFEIQPGYKQAEVGWIPADWEATALGNVIDLLTGFPFPSKAYSQAGIRLLRGSNVKRGITEWSEDATEYWPAITSNIRKFVLVTGDVVIAMDGSLVGRSFAMLSDEDVPALLLQRVARIRSEIVSQNYLKAWICSKRFTEHCDIVKTVTAIPHISPADIRSFKIALPPTKAEQEAIASILSDMDTEITALEDKLAKARHLKQGMMQELLTGRIRLV